METSSAEKNLRLEVREFIDEKVDPFANIWDSQEFIPMDVIKAFAEKGYLGYTIPEIYGGKGENQYNYGILTEEIGRGCSSLRSLITVHLSLVSETINRWGNSDQKKAWLPLLTRGSHIAAFGLSEPLSGSDAKSINTSYIETKNGYTLNGIKKWITFGQIADVFVIIAKEKEEISAFLVEKNTPGLKVIPIKGMMGTRASMLAEIHLENCEIPVQNLLGSKGMGFFQIVNTALDNGRYSIACGSTGISKACLMDSIDFAKKRKQFNTAIKDYQLTKQKITNMITGVKASQLLCRNAGRLRDLKDPNSIIQTSVAKYVTSVTANKISSDALQLHGALGCHEEISIQRYFRDAKIMEIIEGSTEIQQLLIADQGFQNVTSIVD